MGFPLPLCLAALLCLSKVINAHPVSADYFSLRGTEIFPNEENSTMLTLPGTFKYFGSDQNTVYVHVDGFLSFSPVSDIESSEENIIAPLLTNISHGGQISYKAVTSGAFLSQATNEIRDLIEEEYVSASWLFIVTWENVSYAQSEGGATFQAVLVSAGEVSFVLLNYREVDSIEQDWTAGIWAEDRIHSFSSDPINTTMSNIGSPGHWAFRVDGAVVGSCNDLQCTENEECEQRTGVYGCVCSDDNPRPNQDTFDAREMCESSSGTLYLSRCQLFESGFPSEFLYLNDHTCRGKIEGDMVVFHFDNQQNLCGTELTSNGTHFIYENAIQMISSNQSQVLISRERWLNIAFSCAYPLIQSVSFSFQAQRSVVSKDLPTDGTYEIHMIPFPNASFAEPYSGEVLLDVNQQIFIAVVVDKVDPSQIATVLDECWATPDENMTNAVRWSLITNECPNPTDGTVEMLQNGVSTSSHFSFRMFTFTGISDKIYLHCKVHLCLLNGGDCVQMCTDDDDINIQARKRRSLEYHDTAAITMSF